MTDRPTAGVDGASLGRSVELKLVIGNDASGTTKTISKDTVFEIDCEGIVGTAGTLLIVNSALCNRLGTYLEDWTLGNVHDSELELHRVSGVTSLGGSIRWERPRVHGRGSKACCNCKTRQQNHHGDDCDQETMVKMLESRA